MGMLVAAGKKWRAFLVLACVAFAATLMTPAAGPLGSQLGAQNASAKTSKRCVKRYSHRRHRSVFVCHRKHRHHRRHRAGGGWRVRRAYAMAWRIHNRHYPYVWGGGHGSFRGPYDCSGSVSAVLHAGGMLRSPRTSVALERWGRPGRGRYITVYANRTHAFMVFERKGPGHRHFGTGNWGNWGGAGFNPRMHPTRGFVARHFRGL